MRLKRLNDRDFFVDRIEQSKQKYAELFGNTDIPALDTDPYFLDILNHFIYGDATSCSCCRSAEHWADAA